MRLALLLALVFTIGSSCSPRSGSCICACMPPFLICGFAVCCLLLLQRAGQWRQELERFLSTKRSRYTLVEHRNLVGIVMFVYVRRKHIDDGAVKDVQVTGTARTCERLHETSSLVGAFLPP